MQDCCTPGREGEPRMHVGERPAEERRGIACAGAGDDMVALPGGSFLMGTDDEIGFPADGEGPIREVRVDPFSIDRHAVSNAQFAGFIDDTGYVTVAERFGWSFVFHLFVPKNAIRRGKVRKVPGLDWWYAVEGSYWRKPEGSGSGIDDRMDHPAVHISWFDAVAYAKWAGKRLPTEAEWEYAARGGLVQKRYVWGDDLTPDGEHRCNIWQGTFPRVNTHDDGFVGTCPVDSYEPNGFGLHNMAGNVWEWCADWWSATYHVTGPRDNPTGPENGEARVMRGGSYLCHDSYCNRYRVAARTSNTPDSSTGNLGFRCVVSTPRG